jgi:hypothetical protein
VDFKVSCSAQILHWDSNHDPLVERPTSYDAPPAGSVGNKKQCPHFVVFFNKWVENMKEEQVSDILHPT